MKTTELMYADHRETLKGLINSVGFGRQYFNIWWSRRVKTRSPWVDWNRTHQCVFIHVPKNAGSSIYKVFGITEPPETHCTALGYRAADRALWDACFSFAFVRNPFDRFVSAFQYMKHHPQQKDEKAWSDNVLGTFSDFAAFARALERRAFRRQVMMWRHFNPQSYYLCDFAGNTMVDDIARFERFDAEVHRIGNQIGVPAQPARENVGPRDHYSTYYTDRSRSMVSEMYRHDIESFGYEFESA